MGNRVCTEVLEHDVEKEFLFVGRQNEIKAINTKLETEDIIQVYGMTKIGKSRVLVRLLNEFSQKSQTCFYHDFSDDTIRSDDDFKNVIQKLSKALADETLSHEICIIEMLKDLKVKEGAPFILFLDNVNKVFTCKSTKDRFLSFLNDVSSVKGSKLKLIFTTSEKIVLPITHFGQVEIGRMDDEHIDDIIRTIVQKKGISQDGFDFGQDILGENNRIYVDIIVKECEGLPLAAYMVAMELTVDEGMLSPSDAVQLLFNQRVRSLSLEYYPPEDRIDYYKRDIENVKDLDMYFFQTLNRNLDDNNKQYIEHLRTELTKDNDKTKVDITNCFKLLTQPCIIKFLGKTRQIDMHSIFRLCVFEMTGTNIIDDQVFRNLLVENARRYDMDLSDKELDNPKLLEKYVLGLSERVSANQNGMAARPDILAELNNYDLLRRYRFDRRGIEYLTELLRVHLESPTARHNSLSVSEKILIALRFLATGEIQLNVGDLHHVAQSTVSKVVTAVVNSLISPAIILQFIALPTDPVDLDMQVQEFGGVAGFPKVVGVIDGTQVRIIAPSNEEELYVNRKGFHSINVQVIFNASDELVDIVARWPGSTHDSKILKNSGLNELFERGVVPAGYHLLGDSGYPCRRWLLTPYLNPQPGPQSAYNRSHKVTRAKVERGIGQLKRRFGILHGEIRTTPEKACRIITACGVLHNICKMQNIPLPDANDDNDEVGQQANPHGQAAPDVGLRYRDFIAMTYF